MSVAYVDTSALVAIVLEEPTGPAVAGQLDKFTTRVASNLLEAELRAALAREQLGFEPRLVADIRWVLPDQPLTPELATVLQAGYLRGADLWHVAAALYVARQLGQIAFVTLDERQRSVAAALAFQV